MIEYVRVAQEDFTIMVDKLEHPQISQVEARRRIEEYWQSLHSSTWAHFEIGNRAGRVEAHAWTLKLLQDLGLVDTTSEPSDGDITVAGPDGSAFTGRDTTSPTTHSLISNSSWRGLDRRDPST